jgi:hypothetical protein
MYFFSYLFEYYLTRTHLVRTVFLTVDARSSGPLRSAIHHCAHSNLLQKEQQSVKGPDGVSTVGTPMPKLKFKRNIMLRCTINQYVKSFMIIRKTMHCTSLRGLL